MPCRNPLERLDQLADFLRTRRRRLVPGSVGLPRGQRRRAKGLRREEVAELANISTSWYTWLEQARDIRPSVETLEAIANALALNADERCHLLQLGQPGPTNLPADRVPPALDRVLRGYGGAAYIIGRRWDLLAWNDAALGLFFDFSDTPANECNLLSLMFLDLRMRALFVDWAAEARCMLAQFRANICAYSADPACSDLVLRLQHASSEFRAWWAEHDVICRVAGTKRLRHPSGGEQTLEYTALQPDDAPGLRLVMYAPARVRIR